MLHIERSTTIQLNYVMYFFLTKSSKVDYEGMIQ